MKRRETIETIDFEEFVEQPALNTCDNCAHSKVVGGLQLKRHRICGIVRGGPSGTANTCMQLLMVAGRKGECVLHQPWENVEDSVTTN
jgi:hypothetical protein